MLAKGLLNDIGFTETMISEYNKYKDFSENKIALYAENYMNNGAELSDILPKIHSFISDTMHEYTIDLLFVLECTGFLREKYRLNNIPDELFLNAMKDIKCKVDECLIFKHVFGIFTIDWFEGFLQLTRVALGRLQFDINEFEDEKLQIGDYAVKKGDFILNCHIPSSGPLNHEECYASYKLAYEFFKNKLKDDILPIFCRSWLLYPSYLKLMDENSNIVEFSKDYEIYDQCEHEQFLNMWRIFGKEDDVENLPAHTSLQKKFIQYLKSNGKHGSGKGILLFDGENIITRKAQ